jgi:hypothetical protein
MPFMPNLGPHKHAPLNHMAIILNPSDLTKATSQSPPSLDSQISKFWEVLKLVSDALSDPTMPFRPNLGPYKHAPLNHMAIILNISDLTKATSQSPPSSYSQISKFWEVLKLVSDALSDPTMPFRPNLGPHKHALLNHMAIILNPSDLTKVTSQSPPSS